MDSRTSAEQVQEVELESLLRTWRVIPSLLLELRRLHARALNDAVARRCTALGALPAGVQASTWTVPDVAFAHYVALANDGPSDGAVAAAVASLQDVCSRDCPLVDLSGSSEPRDWAGYGLQTLIGDYRRDGRGVALHPAPSVTADTEACAAALELLCETWPEMAFAIDALVREVVWYDTQGGPRSGTLIQAYGAVFLARGRTMATALEDLVHEATHLEVIARVALDKVLLNPQDLDVSPYRARPRPLSRVLHVAMVATRGAEAFARSVDVMPGVERDAAVAIGQRFAESRQAALASLKRSARWTEVGARLWDDLNTQ